MISAGPWALCTACHSLSVTPTGQILTANVRKFTESTKATVSLANVNMKENEETLSVQPGDEVVVKARVEDEEDGSALLFVSRGSECGWIHSSVINEPSVEARERLPSKGFVTMQVRLLN